MRLTVDSGKLAKAWVKKPLADLIEISHGYAFKGADFEKSDDITKPIVLTPGNYSENGELYFTAQNTKRFTGSLPPGDYLFDVGDLTVVMTDLSSKMKILGKPAFINQPNILHNQRIGRIYFKDESLVPQFLYYFFRTRFFSDKIKETATGTTAKNSPLSTNSNNPSCKKPLLANSPQTPRKLLRQKLQHERLALSKAEGSRNPINHKLAKSLTYANPEDRPRTAKHPRRQTRRTL